MCTLPPPPPDASASGEPSVEPRPSRGNTTPAYDRSEHPAPTPGSPDAPSLKPARTTATHATDPIPRGLSPARIIDAWHDHQPLAALVSGATGSPRSRWSILARPTRSIVTPALADLACVESDLATLEASFRGFGPGAGWLGGPGDDAPPFVSGWIGYLSYNLGAVLEPTLEPTRRSDWPLMVWHRVEGALVHDNTSGRWTTVGDPGIAPPRPRRRRDARPLRHALVVSPRERYEAIVARAIEHIRAGDAYQVNLAHTIDARLATSPRRLSAALFEHAQPWYGAHIEHTDPDGFERAICSASPELFLELEPVRSNRPRRLTTRPMKGTLRGDLDPGALERSAKDRAELDMIVDLMRNDLGRIAQTGSVRVDQRRAIEPHAGADADSPGVWQGVATVSATLRKRTTLLDLLRAVFPPGSVTGAPKIRAMQIIEALEGRPRGPYCGCIGYLGDDGRLALNVAIRTALGERAPDADWLLSYSVGAGIVADSDPAREWDETVHKAGVLRGLATDAPTISVSTTPSPDPSHS
ncbi:MAG: anthranilate synthase component I family protein [Phycisphaeraceae bacterium]|nr:anthranilate synthase component I family protein [Phycisphaeraceae bacterium]